MISQQGSSRRGIKNFGFDKRDKPIFVVDHRRPPLRGGARMVPEIGTVPSRWPFFILLVFIFVLSAFLSSTWEDSSDTLVDASSEANDIFHKIDNPDHSQVVSYPTVEEIIESTTEIEPSTRPVVAEPSPAVLSRISSPPVADDETENSLSLSENKLPGNTKSTIPSAANGLGQSIDNPENQSEKASGDTLREEAAANKLQNSETLSAPLPPTVGSATVQKQKPTTKQVAPRVANLPAISKTLPEIDKSAPTGLHYPEIGMEPFESLITPGLEKVKPGLKIKLWSEPTSLLSLLDELAQTQEAADWAQETTRLVRELGPAIAQDANEAATILERLANKSQEAPKLADSTANMRVARRLRQAAYAIQRRLDVWREVLTLGVSKLVEADQPKPDFRQLSICFVEIDNLTQDSQEGQQWRTYMLLDALKQWSAERLKAQTNQERKLAQQVLTRMTQTPMSTRQRQFIGSPPIAALCAELRRWAADPLTPADLLQHIERYEQSHLPSDARLLGGNIQNLAQSSDPQRRELGQSVDMHYRNANLRVSLAENLLNRLIPEQKQEVAPVRDTILGLPVRGQSRTSTDLAVRLIPDPTHVRLALEVTGEVAAVTASTSGPATFYNDSDSLYAARKPLEINQTGIRLMPAEVDVRHQTRLRDVVTDFDGIPLIGWVARSVARSQHEQAKPQANYEARHKVASKARERIDTEAQARLAEMVNNLNRNVFGPLYNLALDPTMIEAQTTEERITMRLRIAGEDQLGSSTPRPQAPADSLASFQINESLLNNALQRLQLEGRTFTLPELVQRISERFQRPVLWQISPDQEDLTITFAKKDAVMVRCQDGQLILTISIAEISKEPRQWNDFQVRVFFRPQVDGRSIELARDGVIHLIGRKLNNSEQIAIRGIFSKAFPKNKTIPLSPQRLLIDPKLQDLAVTQFVIDDGWIGLAIGPQHDTVWTSRKAQTLK